MKRNLEQTKIGMSEHDGARAVSPHLARAGVR